MEDIHRGFPGIGTRHIPNEFRILDKARPALETWNLEFQGCGFEAVRTRGVVCHCVSHDIA